MGADYPVGLTWAVANRTLIMRDSVQNFRINILGDISSDGCLHYWTYVGTITAKMFVEPLNHLMDQRDEFFHVIVDNMSIYTSYIFQDFLVPNSARDRLTIYYIPAYSPELTPIDMVW